MNLSVRAKILGGIGCAPCFPRDCRCRRRGGPGIGQGQGRSGSFRRHGSFRASGHPECSPPRQGPRGPRMASLRRVRPTRRPRWTRKSPPSDKTIAASLAAYQESSLSSEQRATLADLEISMADVPGGRRSNPCGFSRWQLGQGRCRSPGSRGHPSQGNGRRQFADRHRRPEDHPAQR